MLIIQQVFNDIAIDDAMVSIFLFAYVLDETVNCVCIMYILFVWKPSYQITLLSTFELKLV